QTQLSLTGDSVVWQKEIELTAIASDPNGDGDIAWVEFYNDWHKIGQTNQPPFTIKWKNPTYGVAKLSTKVVDKSGYSKKSEEKILHIRSGKHNVIIELKDSITGKIIKGAAIKIEEQLQITGDNGQAVFMDVNGIFSLTAEHDNFKPLVISELEVYSDTTLIFNISPVLKYISVVLHDAQTGEVFSGTSVNFNSELKVTNENGEADFSVFTGEYTYSIDKNSYKNETGAVIVKSDTTFHFYLVRTEAELKIQLNVDSTPVNDARVIVKNDTLYTSALGIARFKNLPVNQEFHYQIYKDGFKIEVDNLFLTTDTTIVVSMQKIPTATEQLTGNRDLKIWPNPVNNELTVSASSQIKLIEVFSVQGIQADVIKPEKSNLVKINVSHLKPGTYFVKYYFVDGSQSIRNIEKF
ncbi:MAG TPA: T9SS type A sorting domain-containing protein, partial [Prolixibacteraceae bacterium]|nr:T9SS type A sorting domain-containing protein [Prolixibacteraceae bacterium]